LGDQQSKWAEVEFAGVSFGDKRINTRLIKLADDLSRMPMAPINQASSDWNATKAAYRLFQNDRVEYKKILEPHIANTVNRLKNHNMVLAIQDTSDIDYTSHKTASGLGSIGDNGSKGRVKGLVMHSTLMLSGEGVPLGLLTEEIISRGKKINIDYKILPTEEKESSKWIDALEKTVERIPEGCNVITVCDREADIYDMFLTAADLNTHVLVRSCYNRRVEVDGAKDKLLDHISKTDVAAFVDVTVPLKKARKKGTRKVLETVVDVNGNKTREAKLEIRFHDYTLIPPEGSGQIVKEKVKLSLVQAKEIDAPDEYEPVEWNLLTTLNIESKDEAVSLVKVYQQRWKIEVYFKVLKSGCKVEDCRLGEAARLIKFVALFTIIAWRIYWMTYIDNATPNEPVTTILSEAEWKALFTVTKSTSDSADKLPTVHEAIIRIACLGGYLNRKKDPPPGPTVIWRGWTRLQDLALMWTLMRQSSASDP